MTSSGSKGWYFMQGSTDYSVEFVWSLLVRNSSRSYFGPRYQFFAWSCPGLDRPGPLDFSKFSTLVWFGPYHLICGRPLGNHGSLDSLVLAEMQKTFQSLQNFQRSSILNVVIWFSMQLDILVLIFVHFRALFWDCDRFSKYLHHRAHSLVIPNSLNSCFSFSRDCRRGLINQNMVCIHESTLK